MDERDRKIIALLQKNGRISFSRISDDVGLTAMGVKKRYEKLVNEGKIKVKALINPEKLEILTALIAMELESSEALERMLKKFNDCPRIIKFFVTTGGYNLFALIYAEDFHSLESVSLEKCSLRSQEGVRRFEMYPIQEIHYDPFIDIKVIPEKKLKYAPCGVHCGDCKRYEVNRCLGCPATIYYRGKL